MKLFIFAGLSIILAGCGTLNIAQTQPAKAVHADLQAASSYANAHGFPARAAVYTAVDAQLTSCENAITANETVITPLPAGAGVITGIEVAAEGAGSFSAGVPQAVSVNCAPLPLITFPSLKP